MLDFQNSAQLYDIIICFTQMSKVCVGQDVLSLSVCPHKGSLPENELLATYKCCLYCWKKQFGRTLFSPLLRCTLDSFLFWLQISNPQGLAHPIK